jgi:hypothetical protein
MAGAVLFAWWAGHEPSDDPIELPDGRALRTLSNAGEYVTALSKADQAKPHWQTAARELMMAAERGGILMLAEIAMRQALAHGRPKPAGPPPARRRKKYKGIRWEFARHRDAYITVSGEASWLRRRAST